MRLRKNKLQAFQAAMLILPILAISLKCAQAGPLRYAGEALERALPGWSTNTAKRAVELRELEAGGPGKDGIPAINNPRFVKSPTAQRWLKPNEPVISLVVNGRAKAYPLQILIWHEIVNDRIGGVPVIVTFCPLCYSAIVFERTVQGTEYTFGTSGMLRNSNLIMYDRQTESLWQQVTGEAIVGDMVGATLKSLPAQIVSFEQFRSAYKDGLVLSRRTGFRRNYGRNPYVGYDDVSQRPFLFHGKVDDRLPPLEKVVAVVVGSENKAYPYAVTQEKRVINDDVGGKQVVIFHGGGAVSALDEPRIARSREVGSTGVFDRNIDGRLLSFHYDEGKFYDGETLSVWDITGRAVEGPLKGKELSPVAHGDYFAFVWLVFRPETKIYR
jgi:hypothetical protein